MIVDVLRVPGSFHCRSWDGQGETGTEMGVVLLLTHVQHGLIGADVGRVDGYGGRRVVSGTEGVHHDNSRLWRCL